MFSDTLCEEKMIKFIQYQENNYLSTDEIEYRIINKIPMKSSIYNYCQTLFLRILFRCAKLEKMEMAVELQKRYFSNIIMCGIYDYESKLDSLEEVILSELYLDGNYVFLNKEDVFKLTDYKINNYKKMLNNCLRRYSREVVVEYLYMSASIVSYISMNSFYLYQYKVKDAENVSKEFLNLIIDTIGLIFDEDYMYLNDVFGREKKAFEYLIHYVLNTEIEYSGYCNEVNLEELLEISALIVSEILIYKTTKLLYKNGNNFRLFQGKLLPDTDFIQKQKKYFDRSIKYTYKIDNPDVEQIVNLFENIEEYSPLIYEKYIKNNDKFLAEDYISNLIEDKLLKLDIQQSIGLSNANIQKLLDSLSLRPTNNIEKDILNDENRLFLTPLIKIGKYYLISSNLMIESAHYFRKRILKNKLSSNGHIKHKIEKNYDEKELYILKDLLTERGFISGVNKQLEKDTKLKLLFTDKNVSKEIDLYFIKSGVLNIVEYKNHELARNIYEIVKRCDEDEKDVGKHLRMVNKINENKEVFFSFFQSEFNSVKSFIVFKNPDPYVEFCKREDIIPMNYNDFYEMCEKI